MANPDKKSYLELTTTDIFTLNDKALRIHIRDLQTRRNEQKLNVVPSVSECNVLIGLAHSELSSRATDRLAKVALLIAVVSMLATLGISIFE